jgi:hypothetical protein
VKILNSTRIRVKNDATTRSSELASRKQVHLKMRNIRNIRNRKGGSRKGASTRNRKRGTISSENINRIWKEAPESRYHGCVPDCVEGGGRAVLGESVTEPAVPVKGEPVAASRPRRRLIISLSVGATTEEPDEPEDARVWC